METLNLYKNPSTSKYYTIPKPEVSGDFGGGDSLTKTLVRFVPLKNFENWASILMTDTIIGFLRVPGVSKG